MTFQIPLHFEDLTRSAAGVWQVTPSTPREATSEHLFDLFSDDIHEIFSSSSPPNPQFNAVYTLITRYQNLTSAHRSTLVDALLSLTRAATPTDVNHLKICLFLVSGLAVSACNTSPPCKYWEKTARESVLEALHTLLSSTPSPPPFQPADRDQLSSQLVRTTLHILEQPSTAKHRHIRPLLARCFISALTLDERQFLPASTALLHALCRHEYIPAPLAEFLHRICTEAPQLEPFVAEFVREIGRLPPERYIHGVTASKSVSAFLTEFSNRYPSVFLANLPLVLSMLDIDSYTLRNGVIHVICVLIAHRQIADDPLLDVLLQHASRDVNAFTRSKALQGWIQLVEGKSVPHRMFPILAEMASSRLDDRTAAVRKYAAQLVATLLNNNPFGPTLRLSHYRTKLEEIRSELSTYSVDTTRQSEERLHENGTENNADAETDGENVESNGEEEESEEQSNDPSEQSGQERGDGGNPPSPEQEDSGENANNTSVEGEGNLISEEQKQAMLRKRFYEFAVEFILFVEKGLETVYNMLRSKSVTDVAEAVSLVVITVQFELEVASGLAVRKMLPLVLAREANIREKAIDAYVRFLAPGGVNSVHEKEAALRVVKGLTTLASEATMGELACLEELINALVASRDDCHIIVPSVVTVLWDLLAGRVPGASAEQRRGAAILVAFIGSKKPDTVLQRLDTFSQIGWTDSAFTRWACVALTNLPLGSDRDGTLCSQLQELCKTSDVSVVEQAINAIFSLSPEPEPLVSSVIKTLALELHNCTDNVPVEKVCRFFVVVGHVAVKELVRIEKLVSQLRKEAMSGTRTDESNEEEEQAGAEADQALELAEKELVNPQSLLGRYGNFARKVAGTVDAPANLRASAVICLAKLMLVQKKFCENNLQLLFSILASECDAMVRANVVVALGDLAFRFPNLVGPWSDSIYNSLRDKDVRVRKNTLMVLTHLILNDMIKVKGQIVRMAVCILDENERIAELARVFFHELSRKSANAIYNILPDTISCMSKMADLTTEGFKTVIALLMGLMDKERHADGMVEKLCHRFRTSDSERENRDLAYCISQLNMSGKGVQKLNESFKSYSVAILDDEVYTHMMQAINKGNKAGGAAGTAAQAVEEVTQKVEAVRRAAGKGDKSRDDGDGAHEKSRSSRGSVSRQETVDESDEHNIEIEKSTETVRTTRAGRGRGARGGQRARGERGGLVGRRGGKSNGGKRPTRQKRKVVVESSESSDDVFDDDDSSESEEDDGDGDDDVENE